MPYFLYRVSPGHKLKLIEIFEEFQEARSTARRLRAEQPASSSGGDSIRMIFADNPKRAQLLLTDPRNPKTDGDD